jgi:hypothetical protein
VAELKRLIESGEITDLNKQYGRSGFRTLKTAMSSFERYEGVSLPHWFELHSVVQE